MSNIIRSQIRIANLKPGMIVEYENQFITVSNRDIQKGFLGYSFRGDASKKFITRIQFAVLTSTGIVLR